MMRKSQRNVKIGTKNPVGEVKQNSNRSSCPQTKTRFENISECVGSAFHSVEWFINNEEYLQCLIDLTLSFTLLLTKFYLGHTMSYFSLTRESINRFEISIMVVIG